MKTSTNERHYMQYFRTFVFFLGCTKTTYIFNNLLYQHCEAAPVSIANKRKFALQYTGYSLFNH